MAGWGGRRSGAGAPKKEPLLKVRRDVAFDVLEVINAGESKLNPSGYTEVKRWIRLLDSPNEDIQLRALGKLKDSADGKPAEKMEQSIVFDPNQPLRVQVEHIGAGRSQDKAPAKTK